MASGVAILYLQQNNQNQTNFKTNQTQVDNTQYSSSSRDTITVELPGFDKTYSKSSGEYTVKASKWMESSIGVFDVYLYKNGQQVNHDSYLSRTYFSWMGSGNGVSELMAKVLNTINIL